MPCTNKSRTRTFTTGLTPLHRVPADADARVPHGLGGETAKPNVSQSSRGRALLLFYHVPLHAFLQLIVDIFLTPPVFPHVRVHLDPQLARELHKALPGLLVRFLRNEFVAQMEFQSIMRRQLK